MLDYAKNGTAVTKNENGNENDEYDPHEHRNVESPTNNWQTVTNFLKASVGTGVLAMPSAFANAGYINGAVWTVLTCTIATYCLHVLLDSMYVLCKRKRVPYLTFSEAMQLGFNEGPPIFKCMAPIVTFFVDGFLALYHFGICCVYFVFIAESVKQMVDAYIIVLDLRLHMCFVLPPILLIYSIRNLKLLAAFSSVANVIIFFGFAVIFYFLFKDLPPIAEREPIVDLKRLPIFFGTVLFAFEAVGVILALEENMKTPKAFVKRFGVLNTGMFVVLTLYLLVGFFGYWRYGDDCLGSITLNIPQDNVFAQIVKVFFALTTWITYALQGYVTANIVWNKYLSKRVKDTGRHVLYETIIRFCIVLLSFLFAIAIPNLSLFLSLVGSLCLSILGLIFPAMLQICVMYELGYKHNRIRLFSNIGLIIFGSLIGIIGTYASLHDIILAYNL